MKREEFSHYRKILEKTQKELSLLLGVSVKAVRSYEQGWRTIPAHVERQMFFLLSRKKGFQKKGNRCWVRKKCPEGKKKNCPSWEFHSGDLCWFISGTICDGKIYKTWREKMTVCRSCEVFITLLEAIEDE